MKWTSFTQLRMEIIKTIKKQRSNYMQPPTKSTAKETNIMKNSKNIKTTRRRKQILYDKKQYYIK